MEAKVPEERKPTGSAEELAYKESEGFSGGRDLEKEADESQHDRRETVRDHIGKLVVGGVYFGFALMVVVAVVYTIHVAGHEDMRWLSVDEVRTIQDNLSNVIIGAILGFLIRSKFL